MIKQLTNYVPMNYTPKTREQIIIDTCLDECNIYGEDRGIILGRIYDKLGIKFEHECCCK